jgi:thiol-disulfide isomerase/thioredoxin
VKWLLLIAIILAGCSPVSYEKKGGEDPKPLPTPPPGEESKVELYLFSAPWCGPCKEMHPEIERTLDVKIPVTLYVVTGWSSSQPPTEAIAAEYKKQMPLDFDFVPDPWKWTTYKKYLGTSLAIPGAVVLVDGVLVKKFVPGTFRAEQVTDYVESIVKK